MDGPAPAAPEPFTWIRISDGDQRGCVESFGNPEEVFDLIFKPGVEGGAGLYVNATELRANLERVLQDSLKKSWEVLPRTATEGHLMVSNGR